MKAVTLDTFGAPPRLRHDLPARVWRAALKNRAPLPLLPDSSSRASRRCASLATLAQQRDVVNLEMSFPTIMLRPTQPCGYRSTMRVGRVVDAAECRARVVSVWSRL